MATGLSLGLFILLLFLLSLGIWVAPALIAIGYILLEFFTPAPVGFNNDNPMNASIFVKIVNKSGINTAITYTLTYVQLEA